MNDKTVFSDADYFWAARAQRAGRSQPLIVVIDDDEMVRGLVMNVLAGLGKVMAAASGPDGMALYTRLAPDLVFLDINMPQVSGLDVLQRMIALDPMAKVIMFSAQSTGTNVESAMKLGAKSFITKPFTVEILLERATHALAGLVRRDVCAPET